MPFATAPTTRPSRHQIPQEQIISQAATIKQLEGDLEDLRQASTEELQKRESIIADLRTSLAGLPAGTKVSDIVTENVLLRNLAKGLPEGATVADLNAKISEMQRNLDEDKLAFDKINELLGKPTTAKEADILKTIEELNGILSKLQEENKLYKERIAKLDLPVDPKAAPLPPMISTW
ncbi:hypothetical protein [Phyllobacterium lublinensis]|uniref:hypothetical protein n=1 Tax=Phyllobacterium lublinensis TaxID=2875708 RepID=UPI001CCAF53E|nr:hypothetical protein [Phyllobacterium sp. 2063]MBZ9654792.1 hypothetical protein [Phyllobacterium sp. 2063]